MTLEQLRIFVAVARRSHLTRAAEALSLTPSALSSALRCLEERYDIRLFDRIGRGIVLTEPGRAFLVFAEATLHSAGVAEQALHELAGTERGRIRVRVSQTIASYWLPGRLMRFRQRYPGLEIELEVGNTLTASQAVSEGVADVGLVEGEVDARSLEVMPVGSDRLIVVVAPHHPWAAGAALAVPDFPASGWVSREPGSGTRAVFEEALRHHGLAPEALGIVLSLPSNEAVLNAVEASECAAALSELAAAPALQTGRLVRASVALPVRAFNLLMHRERHRTRATQALADFLLAAMPAVPGIEL
ncbi:LysR substrate-binding domain-containing protein [Robbsia sp. Bb-Pol-6]|uniref:LysR substrate-binding domain-containing protein n=1 Tax=Robbsia betulipollinis TaxID=2981849 RepID=A0ABT3ZJR8_9BURK|nr:LysR substrate-binding domain-containing protein [Robbsia betulipollinis]MCY0386774.1 LysR substrate-binding domain-containing protein [Robbsia betulipollinis]